VIRATAIRISFFFEEKQFLREGGVKQDNLVFENNCYRNAPQVCKLCYGNTPEVVGLQNIPPLESFQRTNAAIWGRGVFGRREESGWLDREGRGILETRCRLFDL